ncbi:hypothetical protein HETIRDRAFT_441371 [Heterobasidion irregulare TC 32-1]|uniref:Uncharacterized protein n=1 Tax=Heterobasidion irregulare (strain TC 32-1) TaxID=747525 RepID=W4JW85_HETIT|nr:uncharacterized protein HETIRDRAFT_441371 [Heterobasidion irregulare TC 32-1]ETW77734.1 hypothetical protein HETIRDRAFT_441371 [Heterobasidion irregulare TC 32-1]
MVTFHVNTKPKGFASDTVALATLIFGDRRSIEKPDVWTSIVTKRNHHAHCAGTLGSFNSAEQSTASSSLRVGPSQTEQEPPPPAAEKGDTERPTQSPPTAHMHV